MSRRGTLLFALMCVIWGIPYLLIKVAVGELSAPALVFGRTVIGTAVLLPVALKRGHLAPLVPHWRPLLAYTVAELAIPWVLLSTAEKELPSSLTGLLVAAVPLAGFGLVAALGEREVLGRRNAIGLFVGLAGVAGLAGFDGAGVDLPSVLMVGIVVLGYASGPIILSRKLHDLPSLGVVTASLGLCAIGYLPFAVAGRPEALPSGRVIASVLVLGLVCTAVAFLIFFELIREIGPARSTIITYVNPAVAALLGVVFLHETLGVASMIGFVLILTGSVLATSGPRPIPRTREEPVPAVAEP